jgi:hypothetical protein
MPRRRLMLRSGARPSPLGSNLGSNGWREGEKNA